MQQDGNGQMHGEERNSSFKWKMEKNNLVLDDAAGNIVNRSYNPGTNQMTFQVRTDTSTIWMVFVKQQYE